MNLNERFKFASAPDSWGVLDYPGPSWNQSYEKMLDEMVEAGYTGTELGPYGFFPTEPAVLKEQLGRRNLKLLASFVPVPLGDAASTKAVVEQIRKVGELLAKLGAPFLVLADAQSAERDRLSGRVPRDGSAGWTAEQWKQAAKVVADAARVASDYGLDLVFHPHVATYVETPAEVEKFFDVTSASKIGLCLDTGHCVYGGGDAAAEAEKYRHLLRFVHIKDVNAQVLAESRRKKLTFEQAIEEKVFTIIGEGSIDFPAFFRVLERNHYSGWMVVEQDVKFGATAVPPAVSIAASLKYLRAVVNQLAVAAAS
ncbi:MAG TPA: TIM barrel protein [Terriglobales bacterium]|jgi:inosose dehydratase|nr:TIM barrel protein [Terriglobales bacterium]